MIKKPSFKKERFYWDSDYHVFGIDEVGRGSFAGPLVGAAVSFEKAFRKSWIKEINDSKLLTSKKREELAKLIKNNSFYIIESVDVETINKIGVGKANALLFEKIIKTINLKNKSNFFLIDGRKNLKLKNIEFIIKGDRLSVSIAAASIIAKVYRDNLMRKVSKKYPLYGLSKNKGYGTKKHRDAIKKFGISDIHRSSFNFGFLLK